MAEVFPYAHCPKCLHPSLPEDQSLPAACPKCGLILAKFAPSGHSKERAAVEIDEEEPSLRDRFVDAIRYVPDAVNPDAFWCRIVLLAAFSIWGLLLIRMDYRDLGVGQSFLHGPLLIFHEAGHVIFRLFGEFVTILGGTIGQLLMPAIMTGALLRNRDPFAASIGLWFFGISVLDVAPYVYDALHPQLILLGGHTGDEGGHDWIYLLGETGWLSRAQTLGSVTHTLGAIIVLLALLWGGWILLLQRSRLGNEGVVDTAE